jgi:hypothetical protein
MLKLSLLLPTLGPTLGATLDISIDLCLALLIRFFEELDVLIVTVNRELFKGRRSLEPVGSGTDTVERGSSGWIKPLMKTG